MSDTILHQEGEEEEEKEELVVQIVSPFSVSSDDNYNVLFCSSTYCCRISGQQPMDKTLQPGKGINCSGKQL